METRANFILIGLFTLLGILGSLVFFVWLASVQFDRQYAQYGILFDNVSGLDPSGDVLFNGVGVGRVTGIRIWQDDPSKVYVAIEIDADAPVREDTVAQLKSQGVTGVAYVELSGGSPDAPALSGVDGATPIIQSQRSTVQVIVEDAPDLIADLSEIMGQLKALTGIENQQHVSQILTNIETSSGQLEQALADFSEISTTVRAATVQITRFTDRLDEIGASIQSTLATTDTTLESANRAFIEAESMLQGTRDAVTSAQGAFASADSLMKSEVPAIADQISGAIETFSTSSEQLWSQLGETSSLANSRLIALETTLNAANTAFVEVSAASISVGKLFSGDAALLVADARAGLASLQTSLTGLEIILTKDIPRVVTDIENAVSTADSAITDIAENITDASAQLGPLVDDAAAAVAVVTDTLTKSQGTLDGLDGALDAAQSAFDSANLIMSESIDPAMADLRTSAARISDAVEAVAENAPAITQDLLDLIARTDAMVADLQQVVAQSGPDVQAFTASVLPQIRLLAQEARTLVDSLGRLTQRIDQDPAGLIFDNRVPDYRR